MKKLSIDTAGSFGLNSDDFIQVPVDMWMQTSVERTRVPAKVRVHIRHDQAART